MFTGFKVKPNQSSLRVYDTSCWSFLTFTVSIKSMKVLLTSVVSDAGTRGKKPARALWGVQWKDWEQVFCLHFPLWLESSLVMQGLLLLHAVIELRLSTLTSMSVEWVPSDPRLSLPARSWDTNRASRNPSSISVCCMRWRLQLAGLEVSVCGRGDGDWLHCEPMSWDTLSRLSVDKLSSSALWVMPSEPSTPRRDDTLSGTITSCLALFRDRTLFSSAFVLACLSVEV